MITETCPADIPWHQPEHKINKSTALYFINKYKKILLWYKEGVQADYFIFSCSKDVYWKYAYLYPYPHQLKLSL